MYDWHIYGNQPLSVQSSKATSQISAKFHMILQAFLVGITLILKTKSSRSFYVNTEKSTVLWLSTCNHRWAEETFFKGNFLIKPNYQVCLMARKQLFLADF